MPRETQTHKIRIELLIGAAVVAIAIVAIVMASLASSDKETKQANRRGTNAEAEQPGLQLAIGTVDVQSVGPPAQVKAPVRRAVLDATQNYVDAAILAPLKGGRVDRAYEKVFDPFVKPAASKADRATLTEANTGSVKGDVDATASKVHLDALGDPTGKVALVAATFTMNIKASTAAGPLTIGRITELTFANEFDHWVVTAYKVTVRRTVSGATTSTTAKAGTSGAPA